MSGVSTAVVLGATAATGIGAGLIENNQTKKAEEGAAGIEAAQAQKINQLQFQPINLQQLQQAASQQATQNIAQSLALEQRFAPGVAATRTAEQNQVAQRVAQGGNLSPDVINATERGAAQQGGISGLTGSTGALSAAQLGLTAMQVQNQNLALGQGLLASNPLPQAGLSPGDAASVLQSNNNAQNQFNLGKLGAQGNIANSQIGQIQSGAQANNQAIGGIQGSLSSLAALGLLGGLGAGSGGTSSNPAVSAASNSFNTPINFNVPNSLSGGINAGAGFGGGAAIP